MRPIDHPGPICRYLDARAPVLFLVLDPDGTIRATNAFARQRLGDFIVGEPFRERVLDFGGTFDLAAATTDPDADHLLNIAHPGGLPQTYHFNFQRSGDAILAFGRVDADEQESMRDQVLSLNQEMGNLTRQLHKQNAQLQQLNQEKNQFLGMAAHDLRKPIGLVLNYAEFLMDEAGDSLNAEHMGFLKTICDSSIFMKRLVDNFLDVSAIEAGRFDMDRQPALMADALAQSLAFNRLQAGKKGVRLQVSAGPDMPRMCIDLPKIEQVITNLVSNAIEHTAPGTVVAITLRREGGNAVLSVRDQGPGIPAAALTRLFRPFQKTGVLKTGGEKSTGLGLVITRKIIEAHGGAITVDSRAGAGTTITFTLPMQETP